MMAARGATDEVLCCGDLATAAALLGRYDLSLSMTGDDQPIPASYWGEPEAGLDGRTVWARRDTPVHSLLHEAARPA